MYACDVKIFAEIEDEKKERDENVWYRNLKLRMRVQLPLLLLSGGKRAKYTQLE